MSSPAARALDSPAERRRRALPRKDHRGSVTVEAVLLIPLIILLCALMVAGWRLWTARADLQRIADAAARAASQERSGSVAHSRALAVAQTQLADQGLTCSQSSSRIDISGFSIPAGQPAQVSVELTCRVDFSDLVLASMPGGVTIRASATSVLDQFAERGP